jgi:hypothetical protein
MAVRVAIIHGTEYRYDRPVLCGRFRKTLPWNFLTHGICG